MNRSQHPTSHEHDTSGSAGATSRGAVVVEFGDALRSRGLLDALGYLNARTRFRFTGLYRAEPPLLRNVCLFDRENPALDVSGAVCPLDDTYCMITWSTAEPFSTRDAQRDSRLTNHAARDSVLCYSGVPIRLQSGRGWGTLCHFDLRPRLLGTAERSLLGLAATIVAEWLGDRTV